MIDENTPKKLHVDSGISTSGSSTESSPVSIVVPRLDSRLEGKLEILPCDIHTQVEFVNFFNSHVAEFKVGLRNAVDSPTLGQDPLVLMKWNMAGLSARVLMAAANGFVTFAGVPVANADELRVAIALRLSTPPHAATDLGNNHDLFQFLPSHFLFAKLEALISPNLWLRHSALMPDIVDYCQVTTITRANAAVGPVNVGLYFNV